MTAAVQVSVLAPMFNEQAVIDEFIARTCSALESVTGDYELICVDDGSTDATLSMLAAKHSANARIKVVRLSRNFGKESALMAGLEHASGRAVIPIDADLQDPPELIPELVSKWRGGADMVIAARRSRDSDSWMKRVTARLFYRIGGYLSDSTISADAGDFRLLDRRVVDVLLQLPERNRFSKGLFGWVGFRRETVYYDRHERAAGSTKWKYWRLWNYALDGILSFSTLPLRVWTYFGLSVSFFALGYMLYIIVRTLLFGVDVPGYASLIVMVLFFSGLNMIGLGVLGEYLGRIFVEVKQRPLYLVEHRIGFDVARDASVPGNG